VSGASGGHGGALGRWRRFAESRPRLAGAALALALLVGYEVALRPARLWVAEHVAYPLFSAVDTPRARTFEVVRPPGRKDAVLAQPRGPEAAARPTPALWAAPAGVIFLLPAMFLAFVFPARPYWLWLLAYHVALGVTTTAVFALGLGWFDPAFGIYRFARTYLAETVSLTVPLLLYLAGRAGTPRPADDPEAQPA
jgi:hypothetical protein